MTRWEYRSSPVHDDTFRLMGLDGWELVGIFNGLGFFKRPVDGRRTVK
jgi:hypothetical protein